MSRPAPPSVSSGSAASAQPPPQRSSAWAATAPSAGERCPWHTTPHAAAPPPLPPRHVQQLQSAPRPQPQLPQQPASQLAVALSCIHMWRRLPLPHCCQLPGRRAVRGVLLGPGSEASTAQPCMLDLASARPHHLAVAPKLRATCTVQQPCPGQGEMPVADKEAHWTVLPVMRQYTRQQQQQQQVRPRRPPKPLQQLGWACHTLQRCLPRQPIQPHGPSQQAPLPAVQQVQAVPTKALGCLPLDVELHPGRRPPQPSHHAPHTLPLAARQWRQGKLHQHQH